ncbi:hypothetical protein DWY56_01725 [Ruminococcus sp. AF25-3LB]|nr:hypothetical protein DWY56_01725 [Ruminococcus sp. AF25-3LB]
MVLMISTIGCRSKEDDPIEKKDTKVSYQADKIEKPKDISKIQFLVYLETVRLELEVLDRVEKSVQYGIVKIMGKTGYWQEIPNNYRN